jgi:hypothetical protein
MPVASTDTRSISLGTSKSESTMTKIDVSGPSGSHAASQSASQSVVKANHVRFTAAP